jgi:hypothetical protein
VPIPRALLADMWKDETPEISNAMTPTLIMVPVCELK